MVKQAKETPILIGNTGPLNGQQWTVRDEMLLGRDGSCDIMIPDRRVSRHHALISHRSLGFFIKDLNSKNGTYINGDQILRGLYLNDGDVVQIALAQGIIFVSAESTAPLIGGMSPNHRAKNQLHLEKRSRRVWIGGKELTPSLSVAQFRVLEMLYKQEGRVITRRQLTEKVWGLDGAVVISRQALDALIRRLRSRIAEVDNTHNYIMTVRGHGLRFVNPGT